MPKPKAKAPLQEASAHNKKTKESIKDKDEEGERDGQPGKKKKRKIFGTQPTFTWDPVMDVGILRVIPLHNHADAASRARTVLFLRTSHQ